MTTEVKPSRCLIRTTKTYRNPISSKLYLWQTTIYHFIFAYIILTLVLITNVLCIVYTVQRTLYTICCTTYNVHVQCTLYNVHVQCTFVNVHFTTYTVQRTLYNVHITTYSVQHKLYIVH